jgi:uncharacterized membrane protein
MRFIFQMMASIPFCIGILILTSGLVFGEKDHIQPIIVISTPLILQYFVFIFVLINSTRKLGNGRNSIYTNFLHFDEMGVYFNRLIESRRSCSFIPWNHIEVINYSRTWNTITVVPDVMFTVSRDLCKPRKIEAVMLNMKIGSNQKLVEEIFKHDIPVKKGEHKVFKEDLLKDH